LTLVAWLENDHMNAKRFRSLLQPPLQSFRAIRTGGKAYQIRHSEMAALLPRTLFIGLSNEASDATVPLLHIASVDVLQAA